MYESDRAVGVKSADQPIQVLRSEIDIARKQIQELRSRIQPIVHAIVGSEPEQSTAGLSVVKASGGALADLMAMNADIRSIFELLNRVS